MTSNVPALVDAHHHLWDLTERPQPWLDEPALAPIRHSFALGDLRSDATRPIAGRRPTATVAVQCMASVPETRDLLAIAEQDALVGAVVGWADLTSPAVGATLDGLLAGPGGRYLRSLRHLVQSESDPDWLQRPDVERGLTELQRRGLAYDVLLRDHQLPGAVRLARRFPDLPLVLNHAGKPPLVKGDLTGWERQIRLLAGHPHVMCKVSGLVTEADHEAWTTDDIRPVWDVLMSSFGPDRLMFGSDWPVCVLAGGWNRWADAMDELLTGCSAADTEPVLAGTATRFYRLAPATRPSRKDSTP
ncbi:amidohydrolase family protein [Streptomyces sp. NPDC101225]|uniref:amidohydrolase family protein n=1 Tax=Streptomyces sp. NPDC101225 TaxID=3366135 RepID=UPI003810BBE7